MQGEQGAPIREDLLGMGELACRRGVLGVLATWYIPRDTQRVSEEGAKRGRKH